MIKHSDFNREYPDIKIMFDGRILNHDKELKQYRLKNGFYVVNVPDSLNHYKSFLVHVLVMMKHGEDQPTPKHSIKFKDVSRSNRSITNLEWSTGKKSRIIREVQCKCGKIVQMYGRGAHHYRTCQGSAI